MDGPGKTHDHETFGAWSWSNSRETLDSAFKLWKQGKLYQVLLSGLGGPMLHTVP